MDYKVTLEQEVLREIAAGISADFFRYAQENGIDSNDMTNPIVQLKKEAAAMKDKILIECNTLDELKPFDERLKKMRHILEEMQDANNKDC
jgi:hypothetical protein